MDIVLRPQRIVLSLAAAIAFLTVAHVTTHVWNGVLPQGLGGNSIRDLFDLDNESSLPTLFAVIQWLLCVVLLVLIGQAMRRRGEPVRPWFGLAAIFGYLAVDEVATLHEVLSGWLYATLHPQGIFRFPWIAPYAIGLAVLATMYARFLWRLPPRTRGLFVLSAVVFVGLSIGTEALEGRHVTLFGKDFFYRAVYVPIEETGENVGVLIFIFALLDFIRTEFPGLRLTVSGD